MESHSTDLGLNRIGKRQIITATLMALVNFMNTLCFSVMSPFFPQIQAIKREASEFEVGIILGVFELAGMFTCPIFGNQLTRIGSRFMFISGVALLGGSCIIFGYLIYSPDGVQFFVLCLVVRMFQGIASAALCTSSFAILASEFPRRVSTVVGIMETFSGLGYIAGPPLGGFLFMAGGFTLPFLVVGGCTVLLAFICWCLMPEQQDQVAMKSSYMVLLKIPEIFLPMTTMVIATSSLSFIDLTLFQHLENFNLSQTLVGLMFLVSSIGYAITAPLWGIIVDKKDCPRSVMLCGSIICFFAFLLLGPSPFLHMPSSLILIGSALAIMGTGIGAQIIPPFDDSLHLAMRHGYAMNFDTYGLISGLTNACYSMGSFIGPVLGGFVMDKIGFSWSTTCLAGLNMFLVILLASYLIVKRYSICINCRNSSKSYEL